MINPAKLAELKQRIAKRDDRSAINSACGEYNCPCHHLLPELVAEIDRLNDEIAKSSWQVEV